MIRLWVVVVLLAGCGDDGGGGGGDDAGPADARADGGAASCSTDPDCDDGVHCNGAETCDRGECEPGVPVECDDGMECTDDACDEAARGCAHEPRDGDGDGHGDVACGGDDCDDADPMRHPGATEICDAFRDDDCDTSTLGGRDEDTDGHVAASCCNDSVCGGDCDDTSADAHLGASEACDGTDNDCDARIDEEVERTFHRDADGDMFGDPAGPTLMGCTMPAGYSENDTDCDDANPARNRARPRSATPPTTTAIRASTRA